MCKQLFLFVKRKIAGANLKDRHTEERFWVSKRRIETFDKLLLFHVFLLLFLNDKFCSQPLHAMKPSGALLSVFAALIIWTSDFGTGPFVVAATTQSPKSKNTSKSPRTKSNPLLHFSQNLTSLTHLTNKIAVDSLMQRMQLNADTIIREIRRLKADADLSPIISVDWTTVKRQFMAFVKKLKGVVRLDDESLTAFVNSLKSLDIKKDFECIGKINFDVIEEHSEFGTVFDHLRENAIEEGFTKFTENLNVFKYERERMMTHVENICNTMVDFWQLDTPIKTTWQLYYGMKMMRRIAKIIRNGRKEKKESEDAKRFWSDLMKVEEAMIRVEYSANVRSLLEPFLAAANIRRPKDDSTLGAGGIQWEHLFSDVDGMKDATEKLGRMFDRINRVKEEEQEPLSEKKKKPLREKKKIIIRKKRLPTLKEELLFMFPSFLAALFLIIYNCIRILRLSDSRYPAPVALDWERTSTCVPSEGITTMSSSSSSSNINPPSTATSSTATTSKPATHPLETIFNTSTSSSTISNASSSASTSSASSGAALGGGGATSSTASPSLSSLRQSTTSDRSISPKPMPTPTTLSEWQLLAVLSKANLVQYYDVFIAQGGDDINQIMACEEREFLEIMNLVGMLSKPLHVRRMQRALTEYSQDRTAFNLTALQQIGPPPPLNYTPPGTDPMALLLPGIAAAATSPNFPSLRFLSQLSSVTTGSATSSSAEKTPSDVADTSSASPSLNLNTSSNSVPLAFKFAAPLLEHLAAADQPQPRLLPSTVEPPQFPPPEPPPTCFPETALASILVHQALLATSSHLQQQQQPVPPLLLHPHQQHLHHFQHHLASQADLNPLSNSTVPPYGNDFVSLGDFDPNNPSPSENPVLSSAQVARLAECALAASKNLPPLPPRLIQNKKRVSKEVVELLKSTPGNPSMIHVFRKYSAIYGRFDTKRKPHKVLTLHETTVNEAAAQVCLLVPSLLTRRDELFPLARQIVKDAGYHYAKSRKRPCDPADLHSPISSPSNSPPPPESEFDEQPSSSSNQEEKAMPPEAWANLIDKMKDEIPES
ncbi:unnamed protein product [Caenorhabditis sp. 36 PRJEB53466]|nr:unnamed protein product [Caenorhabditis sp. 36 PRJEB53466]